MNLKKTVMIMGRAFDYSKYVRWMRPEDIKPYERNMKVHTQQQIDDICESINTFGWQQHLVITKDGVCVIGHGRRLAAIKLGCMVPVVVIDKDAESLSDEDIRELRIADNFTQSETGYEFVTLLQETEGLDFERFSFALKNDDDVQDIASNGVKQYTEEAFADDQFKYRCPCCGFRFN